jgi:beta-fructofuranosidase
MRQRVKAWATRREFLAGAGAAAAMAAVPVLGSAQAGSGDAAIEVRLASDPTRPQFHLLPAKNWMNDPNGPIYFNGHYHMFFQYNPQAAVWGNMSWNHAVSTDMLHWKHLPLAMTPTAGSADGFGVFSGSCLAVGKRVYAVYTGTQKSDDAHATIRDGANNIQESQCLAWSDDPLLKVWTKAPHPIVPAPPAGMQITGFRDPSVWKQGDWYYMTVGSGVAKVGGCVLLYRSKDLKQWEYLHQLTEGRWDGVPTANPCDDGEMWECPDFFALDGGHVLIYSTLGKVFWQSGTLDEAAMKFSPKKTGELDLGAYYAPKTQLDAQGRRILWGWIPERRGDGAKGEAAMIAAGWSGMMSLPRVLSLDKDGTLRMQVLPQAVALRAGTLPDQETRAGVLKTLRQATGEILCSGARAEPLSLKMDDGTKELVHVVYSPETHSFRVDGREIVLEPEDVPSVHAYVDGSVIEMIFSERTGYTKRFYCAAPTAPDVQVLATGGRRVAMEAWKVAPISQNRLTTPAHNV